MTCEKDLQDLKEQVMRISGEEGPYTERTKGKGQAGAWLVDLWHSLEASGLEPDYKWLFERLLPLERDGKPLGGFKNER